MLNSSVQIITETHGEIRGFFVYFGASRYNTLDKGMKNPEDNLIAVVTNKEITRLYKNLLEIVEDLQKDHLIMVGKIAEKEGEDYAKTVNYFTPAKYEQIRKRILDSGNECERNLIGFLSFFDSTINVERVNAAAQQKSVYKKTIISPPIIIE